MSNSVPELIIILIVLSCFGVCYVMSGMLRSYLLHMDSEFDDSNADKTLPQLIENYPSDYRWALKLIVYNIGYGCVFLSGFLIYHYTRKIKYFERCINRTSLIPQIVLLCFKDANSLELPQRHMDPPKTPKIITIQTIWKLGVCFFGLMGSFLIWGVKQEKIITQPYKTIQADDQLIIEHFHDSQFLIFINQTLAFIVAIILLLVEYRCKRNIAAPAGNNQIWGNAPLYKYSFASFSNIMSAWFQFEALKFVNFPTQVLAKSCKILPVMLMGKIVSRARFEFYEYTTAMLISLGMLAFLTGSQTDDDSESPVSSITGIILMVMYLIFDSFTSNWQSNLFKTHKMSSIQMMCGVDLFSTLFMATSLLIQGGWMESVMFTVTHSEFVIDCILLSISSIVGMFFIYKTIEYFGPVVFIVIMTLRQAVAILISCIIYEHYISALGIIGVVIVFLAVYLRVYYSYRRRPTPGASSK